MEETKRLYDELKSKAEAYGHSSLELVKLKTTEVSAKTAGKVGLYVTLLILALFFLIMLSVGAAVWVGQMLGEMYLGFFLVAGFYLLLAVVLFAFKGPMVLRPIENLVIKNLLN